MFQFSLRSLFIAMLAMAAIFGMFNQMGWGALIVGYLIFIMMTTVSVVLHRYLDFHTIELNRELRRQIRETNHQKPGAAG